MSFGELIWFTEILLMLLQAGVFEGRRIAGGDAIQIEEAPYSVSLQIFIFKKLKHHGGGVLISNKIVLTAAHCVSPRAPVKVRLGSKASHQGGTLIDISMIQMHPNWDAASRSDNDIAVIRLHVSATFSECIALIELADEGDESKVGEMTKISGWGATKNSFESPLYLRSVRVPIVSPEICRATHYEYEPEITNRMICAGFLEGGKDACSGDSGSPIVRMRDGIVIGLVSWGDACNTTNHPGVYTKISYFRGWIRNVTGV